MAKIYSEINGKNNVFIIKISKSNDAGNLRSSAPIQKFSNIVRVNLSCEEIEFRKKSRKFYDEIIFGNTALYR